MLDEDDPDVWVLGFEALAMIDRAEAEPAVSTAAVPSGPAPAGCRVAAHRWPGTDGAASLGASCLASAHPLMATGPVRPYGNTAQTRSASRWSSTSSA